MLRDGRQGLNLGRVPLVPIFQSLHDDRMMASFSYMISALFPNGNLRSVHRFFFFFSLCSRHICFLDFMKKLYVRIRTNLVAITVILEIYFIFVNYFLTCSFFRTEKLIYSLRRLWQNWSAASCCPKYRRKLFVKKVS